MRVVHVVTVPFSFRLLEGQPTFMASKAIDVHAIASPGPLGEQFAHSEPVTVHPIEMTRRMTPWADARSLLRLAAKLRELRPDVVHAGTPKAGLLGVLAAWLMGVPVRIYQVRGLPMLTARGMRRRVLRHTERLAAAAATHVLCNSHSLRTAMIEEDLCPASKMDVLLGGSSNGVDAAGRFNPHRAGSAVGSQTRQRLGIPRDALVIGYIGRLVREKGIVELWNAWQQLRAESARAHLLLVGPLEAEDPIPASIQEALGRDERVHQTGLEWNTPPLYAAMDVFCLPSHREGFPNAVLEAAAMALPVVATRIPGTVDAVQDGITGTLVSPYDAAALAAALRQYIADAAMRARHGSAGRRRVDREFKRERLWSALHDYYVAAAGRQARGARAATEEYPAVPKAVDIRTPVHARD